MGGGAGGKVKKGLVHHPASTALPAGRQSDRVGTEPHRRAGARTRHHGGHGAPCHLPRVGARAG